MEMHLKELLINPPKRSFYLSPFGGKFLEFIRSGIKTDTPE